MKMGKSGVWFSPHGLGRADLVELAQGIERLKYDVLWYPASVGYESLSLGGVLLGETDPRAAQRSRPLTEARRGPRATGAG